MPVTNSLRKRPERRPMMVDYGVKKRVWESKDAEYADVAQSESGQSL